MADEIRIRPIAADLTFARGRNGKNTDDTMLAGPLAAGRKSCWCAKGCFRSGIQYPVLPHFVARGFGYNRRLVNRSSRQFDMIGRQI